MKQYVSKLRDSFPIKWFLGDWRLGLANKTPEYLLRMKTEGPKPVLFDSSKAVDHWWRKGAHKIRPPNNTRS